MKKGVKIGICAAVMLIVAGGVFAGLVLNDNAKGGQSSEEKKNAYKEILVEVEELAKGREETERYLELEIKTAKLSDAEKEVVEDFEAAVSGSAKTKEVLRRIKSVGTDNDLERIVDKVASSYAKLSTLRSLEKDVSVMYDGELSDADLESLSKSNNEQITNLAKDLTDYRAKVKKLSAKDKDFEKSYKALIDEGKELEKKYAELKFEDLTGSTKEGILAYFDDITELKKCLEERVK